MTVYPQGMNGPTVTMPTAQHQGIVPNMNTRTTSFDTSGTPYNRKYARRSALEQIRDVCIITVCALIILAFGAAAFVMLRTEWPTTPATQPTGSAVNKVDCLPDDLRVICQ